MKILRLALRGVNSINEWTGKAISLLITIIALFIGYEVVMRYVFNRPSEWVEEAMLLTFGGYCILAGGYTLLHRGHVNLDILYQRWSPRQKAIADVITSVLFFAFCIVLLWQGAETAWHSIEKHQTSSSIWHPPVYYTRSCLPLAACLLLFQGLAKFIRDLYLAITGKEIA